MPVVVELTRLWLNPVADPTDVIALRVSSFRPGKSIAGEVRQQAGGRLRLIRRAPKPRRISAVLVRPPAADRERLDELAGELVTVRDPDGGKFVAVYLDIEWDRPIDGADVALSMTQVTSSEAV